MHIKLISLSSFHHLYKYHTHTPSFINIRKMILLLTIIIILLLLVIVKCVLPILTRHSQLQRDYRNITLLPLSSIPFVGNLHLIDKRPHVFFQLLRRMSRECQNQDKGIFCLWYALWPMTFLCTAKGLEVCEFNILSECNISLIDLDVH
jgi:hypothetical protein